MKNWITIVEDDDTTITAHFPIARVKSVVEAKNLFAIHLDKGSIHVKGSGVEKLVKTLLSNGQPLLKKGNAGIESLNYNRKS